MVKENISVFHDQRAPEDAAFFTFKPRPDRPELFDMQTSFIETQDTGVAFHIGGNAAGTSTAAACKIARFLLTRQEAPRWDCPFWVVGNDYSQTIESMWREKLYGMGFIPDCEIDWSRVTWYDKRRELPATVPLKPWVNGNPRKNWVLEFRSFAQGRMAMQARALGGFCLTEQFPWEILVEILRGMRQHNFPGSKFCEFTPVDPVLSAPLKEMMDNNTLPPGWAVYRANTLCNVMDPNSPVDKEWYEEFFGMVGDELVETRKTGAWASYEGLIFKSLNQRIHFVDNAPIPQHGIHKRGIDWGGGPYNALVVLWGVKDHYGHWLIYDEFYTTESITWEERIRAIHQKDGWALQMEHHGPPASYKLVPHPDVPVRWRYDMSIYGQTYAPPDDPGAFRECRHYCLPVVQGKTGLANSYHPSIECIQAMLRYTPDEYRAGTAPLLKIDRARCPNLARELQILRWQVPPSHATNPRAPKPLQIKDQDHAPDALRALIYSDWIDMQSVVSGHRVNLKDRPQVRHRPAR